MNRTRFTGVLGACMLAGALAGCHPKDSADRHGHAAGEHDHAGEAAAVSFHEGRGLQFLPETAKAIGLTKADVQPREIANRTLLHATVLKAGSPAVASAIVSVETADELERHPPREARIVGFNRTLAAATAHVEITLELPSSAKAGATIPVLLAGALKKGNAVPERAVLRSSGGTFLYVENGDAWLRTPVKVGANDGDYVEIVDGVRGGEVVAATGVEQLWLTELRLTKGGGHSH